MPDSRRHPLPRARAMLAVAAALVVGAACGDSSTNASDDDGLGQYQPVEVTGEPLAVYADTASDPAVGTPAPSVTGASFDGTPIEVTAGTPTVLVFVAHWCPACRSEVPRIVDWAEQSGVPDGVEFIGVATSTTNQRPNYPPSAWLDREEFPFPVIADTETGKMAEAYGLSAFPYLVALDADHNVVARATGAFGADALTRLVEAIQ